MSCPSVSIRVFTSVALSFLLLLGLAPPAGAQTALTGVVSDELGGAIAGAAVTVRSSTGSTVGSTVTAANGGFSLPPLAPGRYDIEVAMPLFEGARLEIEVAQGSNPSPL